MIADSNAVSAALAEKTGVYTRLVALEMLLFPTDTSGGGLIGSISAALGITGGGGSALSASIPAAQLPTVLFIWGPGRILPVKVTTLTTTEKLYDSVLLNPTHAEVQVGFKVLTPQELQYVDGPLGSLADTAYQDHFDQLIRPVLLTDPGERVNQPQFGAGLRRPLFAPMSNSLAAATKLIVTQSLSQWIPHQIVVQDATVTTADQDASLPVGSTLIRITYELVETRAATN